MEQEYNVGKQKNPEDRGVRGEPTNTELRVVYLSYKSSKASTTNPPNRSLGTVRRSGEQVVTMSPSHVHAMPCPALREGRGLIYLCGGSGCRGCSPRTGSCKLVLHYRSLAWKKFMTVIIVSNESSRVQTSPSVHHFPGINYLFDDRIDCSD